jgi:FixJ family two-component response regulator
VTGTVYVVEDDAAVRDALAQLLEGKRFRVKLFESAERFLEACEPGQAGCLVLDLRLPGMSGIDLQAALAARGIDLPIIFLTGHGDVPSSVRALRAGAVDFLQKPADSRTLLDRVGEALAQDAARRSERASREAARSALQELTRREREVLPLILAGHSSKQIARRLAISHRTVEIHRARIMRKTGSATLVELASVARAAGIFEAAPVARRGHTSNL